MSSRPLFASFLASIPEEHEADFVKVFEALSEIMAERDHHKKYHVQYDSERYKLLNQVATLENEVAKLRQEVDGSRLNQLQSQLYDAQDIIQKLRHDLSTKDRANKTLSTVAQKLEDEKAALESVIAEKDAILKAMETVRDFFKSSPD